LTHRHPESLVRRFLVVLFLVATLVPGSACAQLSWDVPSLVEPYAPQGLSVFVMNPDPSDNLGGLVHWRHDSAALGLGYRVGLGRNPAGHVAALAGVDVSGILAHTVEGADLPVLWWTGFGTGLGHNVMVSVPLGLVAGWHGIGDDNVLAPYVGGHVVLDLSTQEGQVVNLDGSFDVGVDLTLVSGFVVRVGASLGDRNALAVGLRLPGAH
jgi:hypothetical protein